MQGADMTGSSISEKEELSVGWLSEVLFSFTECFCPVFRTRSIPGNIPDNVH